jgi:hypothetical protein
MCWTTIISEREDFNYLATLVNCLVCVNVYTRLNRQSLLHNDHSPCTDGILTFPQWPVSHKWSTHTSLIIYIIYLSYKDTFRIWRIHTRLRSCYYSCLSTRRNIRLQGYPFRHKEIYGHQTTDHNTIFNLFIFYNFIFYTTILHIWFSFLFLFV